MLSMIKHPLESFAQDGCLSMRSRVPEAWQALHHVIPGVHSCHYRHLYPKYREVCKKHKIHLNECEDGFAALRRMWKYLRMLNARNPAGTNGIATNGKQ